MTTSCKFPGCDLEAHALGYCRGHYDQAHRGTLPMAPIRRYVRNNGAPCSFDGCEFRAARQGLCESHYAQKRRGIALRPFKARARKGNRTPCSFLDCGRPVKRNGLCEGHSRQQARGQTLRPIRIERSHRTVDTYGYVRIYDPLHPHAAPNGWVKEHIKVLTEHLGRPLRPGENVHHINGVKADNRLENLELWLRSQPSGQRVSDLLAWAEEIVARYGPERAKL